ncbi:MAG: M48 family metalloprotease [Alphaproteobacteria bacterium]|nr:MAG: M48 family metalloprotease [Alphaproteobacteria bacterium]
MLISLTMPTQALYDFKRGTSIQDQELTDVIQALSDPIYKTVGIPSGKVRHYVVVDPEINAAASVGPIMILHTGILLTATAEQMAGVIAHETGHIYARHVELLMITIKERQLLALGTTLLGAGIMIANPGAGLAVALGGSEIVRRGFFRWNRGKEAAADRTATEILTKLNWPIEGLTSFLLMLHRRENLSSLKPDPYVLTHPDPKDRADVILSKKTSAASSATFPKDLNQRYLQLQAKLRGFIEPGAVTLRKTQGKKDKHSLYARSVGYHKLGKHPQSLELLNTLIANDPKNPYYQETKGQVLFVSGKHEEARASYRTAVSLNPKGNLVRLSYAWSLLIGKNASPESALKILEEMRETEKENPEFWRLYAFALGKMKRMGAMSWALAERSYLIGNIPEAKKQLERAIQFLKPQEKDINTKIKDLKNYLEHATE